MEGHPGECGRSRPGGPAVTATIVRVPATAATPAVTVGTSVSALPAAGGPATPRRMTRSRPAVHFRTPTADVVVFDPCQNDRVDLDIRRWAHMSGLWPRSQTANQRSSAWKMDPNRDRTVLSHHLTRGYPTPPSRIARCECIAQRNARELAEHLNIYDFRDPFSPERDCPWPSYDGVTYIPVPNHTSEDAVIHVDRLPDSGQAQPILEGETSHIISTSGTAGAASIVVHESDDISPNDLTVEVVDQSTYPDLSIHSEAVKAATPLFSPRRHGRRRRRRARKPQPVDTDELQEGSELITRDPHMHKSHVAPDIYRGTCPTGADEHSPVEEPTSDQPHGETYDADGEYLDPNTDAYTGDDGTETASTLPSLAWGDDTASDVTACSDSLAFSHTEPADSVVTVEDDAPASPPGDEAVLTGAPSAYPPPKTRRQRRRIKEESLRARRKLTIHAKHAARQRT